MKSRLRPSHQRQMMRKCGRADEAKPLSAVCGIGGRRLRFSALPIVMFGLVRDRGYFCVRPMDSRFRGNDK